MNTQPLNPELLEKIQKLSNKEIITLHFRVFDKYLKYRKIKKPGVAFLLKEAHKKFVTEDNIRNIYFLRMQEFLYKLVNQEL